MLEIDEPPRRNAFMLIAVANQRLKAAGMHDRAVQMRTRAMKAKGYKAILAIVQEYVVFRD